jgi:DNA invertase Pin-like site-specific DNA recombinase
MPRGDPQHRDAPHKWSWRGQTGAALKAARCGVIRAEKRSGTTTSGRAELQTVLNFLGAGDVLMVTRIDRLARASVIFRILFAP